MKNAAQPKFEVADIVQRYQQEYRKNYWVSYEQAKVHATYSILSHGKTRRSCPAVRSLRI